MTSPQNPDDEDFELHLIRDPEPPTEVPESIRAMRARRRTVEMPAGLPSVQEVLHNPADRTPRHHAGLKQTVRRVMRTQLRLAVTLMAWFFGLVVVGNLAFHFSPALATTRIGGVPVDWLFPVVIVIPFLLVLGWFYTRRTAVLEQRFQDEAVRAEVDS